MEPVAKLLKGHRTGWDLVRHHMDAQLEAGKTTPNDWANYLSGKPFQVWICVDPSDPTSPQIPICTVNRSAETDKRHGAPHPGRTKTPMLYQDPDWMPSWSHYLAWINDHPGEEAPPWIRRIRRPEEHAAWIADGAKPYQEWEDELRLVERSAIEW